MTEATVSAPLMKGLRESLEGSVVVKHRDASMIGLPDCSVTWGGRVLWLEFKLFEWRKWMGEADCRFAASRLLEEASAKAPAQRDMMRRLALASAAAYVIWVKKSFVFVVNLADVIQVQRLGKTSEAVLVLAQSMQAWKDEHPLLLL